MTDRNKNARFMYRNYLTSLKSSWITTSSVASGYSKTNITNTARTKPLRFGGNFTIDSTNNKLYINDGSDQTVTITSGDYSPDDLATEIQTQLNSASGLTWTIAYDGSDSDPSYKFIFNVSASATLRFSQTSNAIWGSIGFVGSTDSIDTAWSSDQVVCHTDEWIKFDLRSPLDIKALCLVGRPELAFPISESATITLEANSLDSWSSPALSRTLTRTDAGIFHFLDDLEAASRTYRWARLKFVDPQNSIGPEGFDLGYLYIGSYLTFDTVNVEGGFSFSDVDPTRIQVSEDGNQFFSRRTKYREFRGLGIRFLENTDRTSFRTMFKYTGKDQPLFVSLDPLVQASNSIDELSGMFRFDSDPDYDHVVYNKYDVSFDLVEAL